MVKVKKYIKRKIVSLIAKEVEKRASTLVVNKELKVEVFNRPLIKGSNVNDLLNLEDLLKKQIPIFTVSDSDDWHLFAKDRTGLILNALAIKKVNDFNISFRVKRKVLNLTSSNYEKVSDLIVSGRSFEVSFSFLDYSLKKIVHLWDESADSQFYSVRTNNPKYKKIKKSDFILKDDGKLFDVCTVNKFDTPMTKIGALPVDIVYTWVNDKDENWRELISKYKQDDIDWDRYHSIDELKYSLRSIFKFAPWVRNIFVVTNCSEPEWYDREQDKVKFISHEEVFDDLNDLPTFNSHAIESCLHKIPELSENFIYFNDDVFLGRNVGKELFLYSSGLSKSFYEPYGMVCGNLDDSNPDYLNASINSKNLLEKQFSLSATQLHKHTPHSLRVSVLNEMESRFNDEFSYVRNNKFRTCNDINVTSFLYHHYSYITEKSLPGDESSCLVRDNNIDRMKNDILRGRFDFFCINDGGGSSSNMEYHEKKLRLLNAMYPDRSIAEK